MRPVYQPRHATWNIVGRHQRFEKFLEKPGKHQGEIRQLLNNVLHFLKQDPLYLPYLYNEVMDMASLVNLKASYGPTDLKEYRDILKRSLAKVKQVDLALGPRG